MNASHSSRFWENHAVLRSLGGKFYACSSTAAYTEEGRGHHIPQGCSLVMGSGFLYLCPRVGAILGVPHSSGHWNCRSDPRNSGEGGRHLGRLICVSWAPLPSIAQATAH